MLILIIIIFILNEKRLIDLNFPMLLIIEFVLLVLFILELKFINKIITKKTRFKKK